MVCHIGKVQGQRKAIKDLRLCEKQKKKVRTHVRFVMLLLICFIAIEFIERKVLGIHLNLLLSFYFLSIQCIRNGIQGQ